MKIQIRLLRDPLSMIGSAVGGQIMGAIDRGNQYAMNKRNQELQIKGQKEMGKYNQELAKEMWEYTGYANQVRQMKEANINPALMYGMKGGGGQTAAVSPGMVAPGGSESGAGQGMGGVMAGLQARMQEVQMKNLEADTAKKEAEAAKIAGVDTQVGEATVASLTQGVQNQQAAEMLTRTQNRIAAVGAEVGEGTIAEQIGKITYEMQNAKLDGERMVSENKVTRDTMNAKIQILNQNALQAVEEVAIAKAKERNINADTEKIRAEVKSIQEGIAQRWTQIAQSGRAVTAQETQAFIAGEKQRADKEYQGGVLDVMETQQVIDGVSKLVTAGQGGIGIKTTTTTATPKGVTSTTQRTSRQ